MKRIESFITKAGRLLDNLAGLSVFATMALVVVNVFLRVVFHKPIQGIYEFVGYSTALAIGFGLAWCALQDGHIAIGLVFEKLPRKTQTVINAVTGSFILIFLVYVCYQVIRYGFKVMATGEVSATAQIEFYPIIFMVALGVLVLCLAEFAKILKGVTQK